jgi:hypothetical protein
VRAVAEGFAGGLAAAAEGVLRLCGELFPFAIFQRIATGIGDNPLFAQRRAAVDEIRSVLGDYNLHIGLRALFYGGDMIARMMKLSWIGIISRENSPAICGGFGGMG